MRDFIYYALLTINGLLMILPPILLGVWLYRRYRPRRWLWIIGAVTFILSQVGHIPFNWLVERSDVLPPGNLLVTALFLGLSAGVWEEGARYLTYRFWARDARSWAQGLMVGAGHGGVEAILLGVIFFINFGALSLMRAGMIPLPDLPAEQLELLQRQIDFFFNLPLGQTVLGGVERLFAVVAHLAMSLLVLQVFIRGQHRWLLAAIGWHTLLNSTAVYLLGTTGNVYLTEAVIGVVALLSLGLIFWLRTPEPVEPEPEPLPEVRTAAAVQLAPDQDTLDKSRYN